MGAHNLAGAGRDGRPTPAPAGGVEGEARKGSDHRGRRGSSTLAAGVGDGPHAGFVPPFEAPGGLSTPPGTEGGASPRWYLVETAIGPLMTIAPNGHPAVPCAPPEDLEGRMARLLLQLGGRRALLQLRWKRGL